MAKLLVAGFSGIGKTMLGKKYKNILDLDSAEYIYDDSKLQNLNLEQRKGLPRKVRKEWPENYIEKIKSEINNYDYVLVWDRIDIIEEYIKNKLDFVLCYPDKDSLLKYYEKRYLERGNNIEYVKKKFNEYEEKMKFFNTLSVVKIILTENETLEDYFIKKGFIQNGK